MDNSKIGAVVQYVVNGQIVFGGFCEYVRNGWVGIRQPHAGGRLDEAPVEMVEIDPT